MTENSQNRLQTFFSKYPVRKYSKGQILLHFDEKLQYIYYLESGRVRQYNISDSGSEIVVNIFRKNTFFPVALALSENPNEHIYEAMNKIEIRKVPVNDFLKFFSSTPEVVFDHLKDVYTRSNKALKRMTYMMASSAYYRIIFELVNECSYLKCRKDGSYRIHLHAYEIAECAGLSRETASREFQKLKEMKIVKVSRKFITVKDLSRLKLEIGSHI